MWDGKKPAEATNEIRTHRERWNADGDRVEDDVDEGQEAGDPEREDQEDDQPNDEPQCLHDVSGSKRNLKTRLYNVR